MATGSVSAIDREEYILIATNSPTSGSTSTFSGLSGYKKYLIIANAITGTANCQIKATFNNNTSNYFGMLQATTAIYDGILCIHDSGASTGYFQLEVNYANSTTSPKICTGFDRPSCQVTYGYWNNTSAITSIELVRSTGTYTGGTFSLYGIAG